MPKDKTINQERVIRPRIKRIDDLNRVADQIKSSPNQIVNFFVDVGLDCFEDQLPKLTEQIKKSINKKLKLK